MSVARGYQQRRRAPGARELTVDYRLAGLSADGSRFRLRHRIFRLDGVEAAQIETDGGWMDLAKRRLRSPPAALAAELDRISPTDGVATL